MARWLLGDDTFSQVQSGLMPLDGPPEAGLGLDQSGQRRLSEGVEQAEVVVVALAQALHEAGAAAHRIEDAANAVAAALGVAVSVFSTPTSLHVWFAPDRAFLVRLSPGDVDLARLVAIDHVADAVQAGTLSCQDALAALDAARAAAPPYGHSASLAALTVVGAAVAAAFGGGAVEIFAAALIALGAGIIEALLKRGEHSQRSVYLFSAFGAGLLTTWIDASGAASGAIVLIAGLIALFPGFTVTTAVSELATGNLVSGTSRFMAATVVLVQIAVGVALARQLGEAWWGAPLGGAHSAPPFVVELVSVLVAGAALSVLFRVPPRSMPLALVACLTAFVGARAGSAWFGPTLGVGLGAFAVSALANASGRLLRRPVVVPQVPAIVLLVPGSVGYRSVMALVDEQTVVGVQTGATMLLIAVSLVAGMILANTFISPRRRGAGGRQLPSSVPAAMDLPRT